MVFEWIFLPILQKFIMKNKEAKASEGNSPRMNENTISFLYIINFK